MAIRKRACCHEAMCRIAAAAVAVVTLIGCVACGSAANDVSKTPQTTAQSQGKHEKVKKSATQMLDGAHLRDNESLYKVYDDSGV